jgi:putative oxidoreductase
MIRSTGMTSDPMNGLPPLVARFLISAIFVQGALGKIFGWSSQIAYMQSHGIGSTGALLTIALLIEAIGVVCLVTGVAARVAAAVMFAYLVTLSILLHGFWSAPPASAGMLQTHFMKNMGIAGGLLLLVACGPGRWTLPLLRKNT